MIRKLVRQGSSTMTVSLPKEWTDRFALKNGDEVEIEEDAREQMIISNIKTDRKNERVTYDFENVSTPLVDYILVGMYKDGLRDVKIINLNPVKLHYVREFVDRTIGFEILESSKDSITLVDLGISNEESLEKAENQIFWKLTEMLEAILNPQADYYTIRKIDHEINKLAFFIQRNLNIKFSKISENFLIYERISALEGLGDAISAKGYMTKITASKRIVELITQVIEKMRVLKKERSVEMFQEIKEGIDEIKKESMKLGEVGKNSMAPMGLVIRYLNTLFEINLTLSVKEFKVRS